MARRMKSLTLDDALVVGGAATVNSLSVTNNASVGGTLGVTGATTLGDLSTTGNITVNKATAEITLGNSGGQATLSLAAAAGNHSQIAIYNGATAAFAGLFWAIRSVATTKDFNLIRYNAGVVQDIPLSIASATGAITLAGSVSMTNSSGLVVGVAGTTRGRIRATRGSSTNTPGVLELVANDGTAYFFWVTTAGVLRRHTSLPTSDSDGSAV